MPLANRLLSALLCAVLCAGSAQASARDLQAVDEIKHEQVLYNASVVGTDPLNKLSFSDPRLQRTASGLEPEQVRTVAIETTFCAEDWLLFIRPPHECYDGPVRHPSLCTTNCSCAWDLLSHPYTYIYRDQRSVVHSDDRYRRFVLTSVASQ